MTKQIPDIFAKCYQAGGNFSEQRMTNDQYYIRPILESPPGPHVKFQGKDLLIWSINDYLGLVGHPEVKEVALKAVEEWGLSGPMGARMLTGNTQAHMDLEQKLAQYTNKQDAHLCSYGYIGVMGGLTSLVGRGDTILIDRLSHSCMIDGAIIAQQISGQRMRPFKHNDLEDLERQLQMVAEAGKGGALIVTEGVFGMRGDMGDLKGICKLKQKYGARLYVDDAHGFGVMGAEGRGTGEHQGIQDQIDVYFGTFAKSFACIGGVTSGDNEIVQYIRFNSKQDTTSKSLPYPIVKAVDKTLEIILREPERREKLWHIATMLRQGLLALGFEVGEPSSPITPVYIPGGDVEFAKKIMYTMREEHGIFVSAITYPIVPMGTVILRMIPTANHSEEDVERTLLAFKDIRDRLMANRSQAA
jgi:glycine C-acetyltransferase